MCLIAFAWCAHPRYPLILAANRDEFHARAARPAAYWEDAPAVYAGRDLVQNGAWLALSRHRRLAAVTNVRRMLPQDPNARSRGGLVSGFVQAAQGAADHATLLAPNAARYGGFNLLLWDGNALHFCSNQPNYSERPVEPGVHVLSNATLDTPWPKSQRLEAAMHRALRTPEPDVEVLLRALSDTEPAPDSALPDTGFGLERERWLSPPFIRGTEYGTRATSIVLVGVEGARFIEHRFGPLGERLGVSDEAVDWLDSDP